MLTMIGDLPSNVVGVEADGRVTAEDYERLLIPAFERAHAASPGGKVRVLYVLLDDFPEYTPGAIWEDTKLGLGHLTSWERIAIVCDADHGNSRLMSSRVGMRGVAGSVGARRAT